MTNTFFTADWHIGHKNIITLDNRPFTDLDHMASELVSNYNALVQPDDICFFLGDMMLGKTAPLREVLSRLNGNKILILGNHDRNPQTMLDLGFNFVYHTTETVIAGERVTMSHCPLRGIQRENITGMRGAVDGDHWHGESKHIQFSVDNEGQFHLCGHTHKKAGGVGMDAPKYMRQWDVGVAGNGYKPVSLKEVEEWVTTTKSPE